MPGEIKSSVTAFRQAAGSSGRGPGARKVTPAARALSGAGGGAGTGLQNILKSPLMNIEMASGSRRLCYKFTNRRNVCLCCGRTASGDIN